MQPTEEECKEYRRLIDLKAWGARYFELHDKIKSWNTAKWVHEDVFGSSRDAPIRETT